MKSSLRSRGSLLLWFLSMFTVISVQAQVVSPEKFNADGPMEIKATSEQVARFVESHAGKSYLLFPEDRGYPIRMTDAIPHRWIEKGPSNSFHGSTEPGEFYVFQVAKTGNNGSKGWRQPTNPNKPAVTIEVLKDILN